MRHRLRNTSFALTILTTLGILVFSVVVVSRFTLTLKYPGDCGGGGGGGVSGGGGGGINESRVSDLSLSIGPGLGLNESSAPTCDQHAQDSVRYYNETLETQLSVIFTISLCILSTSVYTMNFTVKIKKIETYLNAWISLAHRYKLKPFTKHRNQILFLIGIQTACLISGFLISLTGATKVYVLTIDSFAERNLFVDRAWLWSQDDATKTVSELLVNLLLY